jgi:CRP-like cAMP-binding protein
MKVRRSTPRGVQQSWLPDLELFAGCNARQRRDLSTLLTPVDVRAGRVLCRQGECAEECFVVVDGHADVFVDDALVAGIGPGELVGELALLAEGGLRTATVVAATDMSVLVLSRREFNALEFASPSVLHRVLRDAARRLVENANRR